MADLILVKTTDISKVPHKANQLIFVKDGEGFDLYFDYSKTLRLHNSEGAKLTDFEPGKTYVKDDMCVRNGLIYRAISDLTDTTFIESHWQLMSIESDGEGGGSSSNSSSVTYDPSQSGLQASTVQSAIDELVKQMNENDSECEEDIKSVQQSLDTLEESHILVEQSVNTLETTVETLSETALTTETNFELDTF